MLSRPFILQRIKVHHRLIHAASVVTAEASVVTARASVVTARTAGGRCGRGVAAGGEGLVDVDNEDVAVVTVDADDTLDGQLGAEGQDALAEQGDGVGKKGLEPRVLFAHLKLARSNRDGTGTGDEGILFYCDGAVYKSELK